MNINAFGVLVTDLYLVVKCTVFRLRWVVVKAGGSPGEMNKGQNRQI